MAPIFNIVRASVYAAVLLFSVICLAMSAHFQHVLSASDLTRFVPFAIFVCSLSMIIFVILLVTSLLLRERNPVSTRIELACLGLVGFLWLVLGAYLTSSDAQDADVECFASDTSQTPLDDSLASFHTDQYQAMYRVLLACAWLNAVLVLLCFFILGALAYRRHRNGDQHMWYAPVTSGAWFHNYASGKPQRSKSSGTRSGNNNTILPTHTRRGSREKPSSSSRSP
ncbi:hypothetical protein DL96DRAFT_1460682 [Flagelloscypha sp. PMI_526]|nr:hypothetical protein DL96DRAFT_1460682 [Flagelloscypha sp. PMI_526]